MENKHTLLHLPVSPQWPHNAVGILFKPHMKPENLVSDMSLHFPNSHEQVTQAQENPAPSESDAKTQNQVPRFLYRVPVLAFQRVAKAKPSQIAAQKTDIHGAKAALLI